MKYILRFFASLRMTGKSVDGRRKAADGRRMNTLNLYSSFSVSRLPSIEIISSFPVSRLPSTEYRESP